MLIGNAAAVQNHYTYDPFGTLFENEYSETIENPYRFAGYWWDEEIAQYYCRARMYDPQLKRFTSIDPVMGEFTEPLTLHQYLCCVNDSVNRWDPDGRWSMPELNITSGIKLVVGLYEISLVVNDGKAKLKVESCGWLLVSGRWRSRLLDVMLGGLGVFGVGDGFWL